LSTSTSQTPSQIVLKRDIPLHKRYLPFLGWLPNYSSRDLVGDVIAGIIVAIMLIPQSMALALLAGLPPQVGLYTSILPPIVYGLLGSSRTLSTGPVALTAIMVAAGVGALQLNDPAAYIAAVALVAVMVGLIQLMMGIARLGFLVALLSHPMLSGLLAAVALIIGLNEVDGLLGISVPRTSSTFELVSLIIRHINETNLYALTIGVLSIIILLVFGRLLPRLLKKTQLPALLKIVFIKSGPLIAVVVGSVIAFTAGRSEWAGVSVVGMIPAGLPAVGFGGVRPALIGVLLPTALAIAMVSYVQNVIMAKSLAGSNERIDADQELIAQGIANTAAGLSGGFPVAGGFSRSMVNYTAGARTGLASVMTGGLIALTVVFLTPLFHYLPYPVLSAIIVVAISSLLDVKTPLEIYRYSKADSLVYAVTFGAVLGLSIELGMLIGVAFSLAVVMWRISQPQIVVEQVTQSCPQILALSVDRNLYFVNARTVELGIRRLVADNPMITDVVISMGGVEYADITAIDTLTSLREELNGAGIELHLADVPEKVQYRSGIVTAMGRGHIHQTLSEALHTLSGNLKVE